MSLGTYLYIVDYNYKLVKKHSSSFIIISFLSIISVYSCSVEGKEVEPKARNQFALTVTASKGGSVSPDANGTYDQGATITITATPDEGYKFDRWKGTDNDNLPHGCWAGPNRCRAAITMNSDRDVKVFFEKSSE